MCGRAYETYTEEELEMRYLTEKRKSNPLRKLEPNFNLAPNQLSPVILVREDQRVIDFFRWGLIPTWVKDIRSASKYSMINARSEEIAEKVSYSAAFSKRRCIVPISGFYEWKKNKDGKKSPFLIRLKEQKIMSLAGIWERWRPSTSSVKDEEIFSFAILTTAANPFLEKIHHRMPVLLDRAQEGAWLDPQETNPERIKELIRIASSQELETFEISSRVNSPKNNSAENLKPVAIEPPESAISAAVSNLR